MAPDDVGEPPTAAATATATTGAGVDPRVLAHIKQLAQVLLACSGEQLDETLSRNKDASIALQRWAATAPSASGTTGPVSAPGESQQQQQFAALYLIKRRVGPAHGHHHQHKEQQQEAAAGSGTEALTEAYSFDLATSPRFSPDQVASLTLIKRHATLDPALDLAAQVHVLTTFGPASSTASSTAGKQPQQQQQPTSTESDAAMSAQQSSGSAFYEGLHRLVHYGVAPAFDAFVEAKNRRTSSSLDEDGQEQQAESGLVTRGEKDAAKSQQTGEDATADDKGVPVARKKFAELELELLHLQQNVEIPHVELAIHPAIARAVASARQDRVKPSVDALDQALLADSAFLNRLQAQVNQWIREIQTVTKLSRDVASGTAAQEINFWLGMESALEAIEDQLRSEPVALTLDVLRHAKRFHATVSFIADTGLKEASDLVLKYNQLMKDFPLNELLAATDLPKIHEAVEHIFAHLNKKLKVSPYPVRRALPLVEAISRDLADQLTKCLAPQRLMHLDHASFEQRTMQPAARVFAAWDDNLKEFTNVAREVTRKRAEKFLPIKIQPAHARLHERLAYLRAFRKQHNHLLVTVGPLRSDGSADVVDMEHEVQQAYEAVKNVDVLDTSPEGTHVWVASENAYNDRIARVEGQLIARLRDALGAARSANEMFRVFQKFNALFVRPRIRGAIAEYQSQLIESVKEDIRLLHDKFKRAYHNSHAYQMAQLRDLPPVAGAIVWARQIERQLQTYMKRVEDVLGKGWELYAEGQKLQAESVSFRRKLDTRPIYDAWLHDINRKNLQISGHLFDIARQRGGQQELVLTVNFDPQIIALFKEVRNLLWLGFQVPHTINNVSKDAKRVYPHAVSLMESVRTYAHTSRTLEQHQAIAPLVADYRAAVQHQISRGMAIRWESFVNSFDARGPLEAAATSSSSSGKHRTFVREFASAVSVLKDRTDALVDVYADLMRIVDQLATCTFTQDAFADILDRVQRQVDKLSLEGYANLEPWVAQLDAKIEGVLLGRLMAVIEHWCASFGQDAPRSERAVAAVTREEEGEMYKDLRIGHLVHEICIRNQVLYLDPPVEKARADWYRELQSWLTTVCGLSRVQSSRYEIGLKLHSSPSREVNYASLLNKLGDATLVKPFALIEAKVRDVADYVDRWLQFQSLWDLEGDYVYNQLGDSLAAWQKLLLDIRRTRATFDNSDTSRSFGCATVNYEQVQNKVNAKYDAWQRDILVRFGARLGASIRETHAAVFKARRDLESHSIEGSSTAGTVSFITLVQTLKRKVAGWAPEIEIFGQGQKTLERYRYQFASDWLYVDQVESEWGAFNEILNRKDASIQDQLSGLQLKIIAEDKIVANRIADVSREWEENKPIQGSLTANAAINTINVFESRVTRLHEELEMIARAKEALDLELVRDDRLEPVLEEIRDLKDVWTALSGIWAQIEELREALWTTIQPRRLRQQLESLLAMTREMPSRMRQYAAFEYVQDNLRQLIKSNAIIADLKSEAVKERHWRSLLKAVRSASLYTPSSMTLGFVWDLDLKKNEVLVREVIVQAQGEMALEEFLKQVKDTWSNYAIELVNYQNKTRLIRGWDDLFTKCSENLNSLSAMKLSPYYKVFEEDATVWEDRLNRVHVLFDVWIDVQRQWVYLEGIFAGNTEIKHLLPVETQRFNSINSEFLAVLKKVFKSPFVLDVLAIPGVQKSMERLAELLSKIQKALGEYLERERASFPRFYFVGDEDLLEIIGNSKDVVRVGKFLKKMFAGLSSLLFDDDLARINGFASREGEEVMLDSPIVFKDYPRINDWLAKLEEQMKVSLAKGLIAAHTELVSFHASPDGLDQTLFLEWLGRHPAQLAVLAMQIACTHAIESALQKSAPLDAPLAVVTHTLDILADSVVAELSPIMRRKCEQLITELVHQRDILRALKKANVSSAQSFEWLYNMRFYLDVTESDPLKQLTVKMANASFLYGFEYLGVRDRLVQTPLTDRCYLTLTQALSSRLGGSPFGPAGTGKTESVKALGDQLGRFVIVFCCDETFDFQAMGRIFVGLCQVGAWGCFDEFNRLEERILSAVSQQIQTIQLGLGAAETKAEIELVGRKLVIHQSTGIFITMNPGYAGRSNLPDNLKKLFRSIAMTKPDRELIAQVMLFSQGFRTAESLASKIVPFFELCMEQLSSQPHYDFGLRALKAVLVSAGHLKRGSTPGAASSEQHLVIQSVMETIVPKLVADDVQLLTSLLADVFPGVDYVPSGLDDLKAHISAVCEKEGLDAEGVWMDKVVQLYQIQNIQHGLMLVGPSATGKMRAWRVLLAALERLTGVESMAYVIDPKAISKDELYGTLDATTREWNDGLFTSILRRIVDDVRAESSKRHWIVFDGDVDPEWVENLNSVLDDNKLLTLPNGERLNLPPNVRILFEVETLRYATLATVSRCGMIWFSEDSVSPLMLCRNQLRTMRSRQLAPLEEAAGVAHVDSNVQSVIVDQLSPQFEQGALVMSALDFALGLDHVMDFTATRALTALFSLLAKTINRVLEYNAQHSDFPLSAEQTEAFVGKRLLLHIVWAFAGDSKLASRATLGDHLRTLSSIPYPALPAGASLIDYDVQVATGEWVSWQSAVPTIEVETHAVLSADAVIPTIDTVRHEDVLYSWLSEHKPMILCGPPGSGKTMTLFSALRKLPDMEVVGLNFSSATTPQLILKALDQYCEYRKTSTGVVLAPAQIGRWVVLFCDEINLPAADNYGTQRAISFLRQLVEQGGFWRKSDRAWVTLERIQFVGACNPPTDPGRVPLSNRFLRHVPVVMVDYPGETSLKQIYGTFARAILKVVPTLRAYAEPLTDAMVEFYLASQARFTSDIEAHYVYSPRELTRWCRGIFESLRPLDSLSVEGLVRIWAHEALRLFQDRLVRDDERKWTDDEIDRVAMSHFATVRKEEALARPILFSNWTSRNYVSVDREELREFTKARLRIFYEEELDVQLVLFNDVLDHVLRIDRVFRQVQGHLLLIGVSGSGKTTLSRFVAWMNGMNVFQIKVHNKYSGADFDDDLRTVLRRAGCKGEKIVFVMDESNVLDSGFLERMNTLLANAEIPGLFEGDEYSALMTACKEGAQRDGVMLDTPEELYRWFTEQVARNLHVVFTMNPPQGGLASRAATSPALFNRCVLDWFGDWSEQAFFQVGSEFTLTLDLDAASYAAPAPFPVAYGGLALPPSHRNAVVNAFVHVHKSMYDMNARLARRQGRENVCTPRHYLDFVNHFVSIFTEKRDELEEQQRHLNVGLDKLHDTVTQVEQLRKDLATKRIQLEAKNNEANDKLRRMVADQQDAEQKKIASIEIQSALETQKAEIADRTKLVMGELAEAEPAVQDAQAAVSNIKKQHLTEVRTMANPPEAVKLAMESVCAVLGFKIDSWKTVQSVIRRDDFITSIVNFDTRKMTDQLRERMKRDYLSRDSFTFDTVNRASKACGPLCKWVIAQVHYSDILDKVGPLRNEVDSLERQARQTEEQASMIVTMIAELERRIASYKDEYALLISDTQAIKGEMEKVQRRVDRSMLLLQSLESERTRWESSSRSFEAEMSTVAGDVLLSAAFMAYAGFFDQHYREILWQTWSLHLDDASIMHKPELAVNEYLSDADDRLGWQSRALPAGDVSVENAIMLKRYKRYPLIVDPSGQATNFLLNEYRDRKLSVTSFLDESFIKNLESALRFGTPLLVQDVEYLDPVLNTVLNRELRRAGGRVLIRLGNQDIDFSPAFQLFLSTRDPSAQFGADLLSRVTVVNFVVTRASLQSQCLSQVLQAERPETDQKRRDLLRMQGEFRTRLLHLERRLLAALNESEGNILDDDRVIGTLETLKREAAEITKKVEETDVIMKDVDEVTRKYTPLALACSSLFFVLDELAVVNHFYRFSLAFFFEIFNHVLLQNPALKAVRDPHGRLEVLMRDMFVHTFKRTSRALLHSDHLVLALLLAQVKVKTSQEHTWVEDEYEALLTGVEATVAAAARTTSSHLDSDRLARLDVLARFKSLQAVVRQAAEGGPGWRDFMDSSEPETNVPGAWTDANDLTAQVRKSLLIKALRPDRLRPALQALVREVFGADLLATAAFDLAETVSSELSPQTPVCLCSVPGYDASFRVESLVAATNARCISVAMGSPEGFTLADQAIADAARTGAWVLLKNVHLAPAWLDQLEKRLQSLKAQSDFRLFLTMETSPKIPANILRQGRVIMNEPPTGIRASLLESLSHFKSTRTMEGPAEKARLYFLLAWFHAVVQERLRFAPLGWTKTYDFNETDREAALDTIDAWLAMSAKGRANIDPATIPWIALRVLIREAIYGGRIDADVDQAVLDAFVGRLFTPRAYDIDFELVGRSERDGGLSMPDVNRLEQYIEWASQLPAQQPPSFLSLPASSEKVIASAQGRDVLTKVVKLKLVEDDESSDLAAGSTGARVQPAWMRELSGACAGWLSSLPQLNLKAASTTMQSSPLDRYFAREAATASKLLEIVRADLGSVLRVCDGQEKQTNTTRSLLADLAKGQVPTRWRLFKCREMPVSAWVANFARRMTQVRQTQEASAAATAIEIGLLFHPHGFVTATRQAAAHSLGVSLETLQLSLRVGSDDASATAFPVDGLGVSGALWADEQLKLDDSALKRMPKTTLTWADSSAVAHSSAVEVPCWLDATRADQLFTVSLAADGFDSDMAAQHAVSLLASVD